MSDAITRAAKALYEDEARHMTGRQPEWRVISTYMKNYYRGRVTFVLQAVAEAAAEDVTRIAQELDP